jgi:DNA-binding GntR family transcriptional regulator
MVITRRPLREAVREAVLERLDTGALPVGANVNEPELADELGVSRTPLREALLGLEHEGLLVASPGRGWVVAPLTPDTVFEVYPIIWALECEALRGSEPAALQAMADELELLNARLRREEDPHARMRLDDQWHALLLSACPNRRLVALVAAQKRIVHRYEFAYMSAPESLPASTDQHGAIVAALREGDVDRATEHLGANWRHSVAAIAHLLDPPQ